MAPQAPPGTSPIGTGLSALGAGLPTRLQPDVTPDQAAQQSQIQQANAPLPTDTGQPGPAADPLTQQADALSKLIAAQLMRQQKPSFMDQLMSGFHSMAIAGMAPPGNAAAAVNEDLARQQQAEQAGMNARIQMLNDIRQRQYQQQQLGIEQQKAATEAEAQKSLDRYHQGLLLAGSQKLSGVLAKQGMRMELNPYTGLMEPVNIPEDEYTPMQKALLDKTRKWTELQDYTERLDQARTELANSKNDPSSPEYKLQQEKVKAEEANVANAAARVKLSRDIFTAGYTGKGPGGEDLAGVAYDTAGRPIGPKVLQAGKAPSTLTVQSAAADRTLKMIDVVRDIVKDKPYLVGPAMGRVNELGNYIGGNPLKSDEDERDAALLAGHLAYLFTNEIQGAVSGRPNPAIVQTLKANSAQMKDDPRVLEGFLKSAENNANIAKGVGGEYGVRKLGVGPPPAIKPPAARVPPPKIGEVQDGQVFLGGDPKDKKNWRKQ